MKSPAALEERPVSFAGTQVPAESGALRTARPPGDVLSSGMRPCSPLKRNPARASPRTPRDRVQRMGVQRVRDQSQTRMGTPPPENRRSRAGQRGRRRSGTHTARSRGGGSTSRDATHGVPPSRVPRVHLRWALTLVWPKPVLAPLPDVPVDVVKFPAGGCFCPTGCAWNLLL